MGQAIFCERCGEQLNERRAVWLEKSWRTGLFHAEGGAVPTEESQGGFPFGAACARAVLAAGGKVKAKPSPA